MASWSGFTEPLLDGHFRIKVREKWYESVEEIQKDLDAHLPFYNTKGPHQGRDMNGRTPLQAFTDGLKKMNSVYENGPKMEAA